MEYRMTTDELKITQRHLPHWTMAGATYFVTFRIKHGGELTVDEQMLILEHIKGGDQKFYKLAAVVVMPDHAHILLIPRDGFSLSQIMKGMKGSIARELNRHRHGSGSIWQDELFDRIVRDQKGFSEKLNYMLNNPIRRGLTEDPWNYHGWYYNEKYFE